MGERKFHKTLLAGAAAALIGASEMNAEAKPPVQPVEPETTEQAEKAATPEFEKVMVYDSIDAAAKGYVACMAVWNECTVEESLALIHYSDKATVGTDVKSSVAFDGQADVYSRSRDVSWESAERAKSTMKLWTLKEDGLAPVDYGKTMPIENFRLKEVTRVSQEHGRKTEDERVFTVKGGGGRKKSS